MQLVEQHCIGKNDPRYGVIDAAAFASKNLYNAANYRVRQSFIFEGKYLNFAEVFHLVKHTPEYKALPAKVANDVLRLLDKNWRSFFAALKEWGLHPEKFLGRPKLPKYKDKQQGRNILIYDIQALSKPGLAKGKVIPSKLLIEIPTLKHNVKQARIVPRHGHYVVEIVYERGETQANVDPALIASAPDGHMIASGRNDAIVQLWDAHRGTLRQTLHGQSGAVYALAWSPDGRLLASGGLDGGIRLWELPGAQPEAFMRMFTGHTDWVFALAFAPDERTLASGSFDRTVKLWDVGEEGSLHVRETLAGHTNKVRAIAWSPDGHILASCGFDQTT